MFVYQQVQQYNIYQEYNILDRQFAMSYLMKRKIYEFCMEKSQN